MTDSGGEDFSDLYVRKPIPRRQRVKLTLLAFGMGTAFMSGTFVVVGLSGDLPWSAVGPIILASSGVMALLCGGLYVQLTFSGKLVNKYLDDDTQE